MNGNVTEWSNNLVHIPSLSTLFVSLFKVWFAFLIPNETLVQQIGYSYLLHYTLYGVPLLIWTVLILIFFVMKGSSIVSFAYGFWWAATLPVFQNLSGFNSLSDRYSYIPTLGFSLFATICVYKWMSHPQYNYVYQRVIRVAVYSAVIGWMVFAIQQTALYVEEWNECGKTANRFMEQIDQLCQMLPGKQISIVNIPSIYRGKHILHTVFFNYWNDQWMKGNKKNKLITPSILMQAKIHPFNILTQVSRHENGFSLELIGAECLTIISVVDSNLEIIQSDDVKFSKKVNFRFKQADTSIVHFVYHRGNLIPLDDHLENEWTFHRE